MQSKKKTRQQRETLQTPMQGANTCVLCGALLPEGSMVCRACESRSLLHRCSICKRVIPEGVDVCPWCEAVLLNSNSEGEDSDRAH